MQCLSHCNLKGWRRIGNDSGFSKTNTLFELNRLMISTSLRVALKWKDYRKLDTVFPFVVGFMGVATEIPGQAQMRKLQRIYTNLVSF